MIGELNGILREKQAPSLLLEVHGVGYEIEAPMSTFYQLPELGQSIKLLTHLVIREDMHQLFGFYTKQERSLFRTLLKVNGVGPKLALTILSSILPEIFVAAILNNDTAQLIRVPGIGKKTAERLIIEMRDRLNDWNQAISDASSSLALNSNSLPSLRHPILQDAISALVALGYKSQEANRIITKIDDNIMSREELIRRALREMMT